ncbi:MAG: 23S rRNA (guanosine(2251)-2'-O)-methyltransferase RlmB [Legionella sp.]|nr:23S rRNA (guanosine(2251)-2'-O)-methyltransferase RlmB [Legionella sp.]
MNPTTNNHDIFVYGIHAVTALLKNVTREIKTLYVNQQRADKRIQPLLDIAAARGLSLITLSMDQMNQRFPDMTHQGIVACAKRLPQYQEKDLNDLLANNERSNKLILVLDGITDPHNFGACLRTADAAGVDLVITPKDKSAPVTPVVAKVACGATETVPILRVTNLVRTLNSLKEAGIWIYGAALGTTHTLYDLDFTTSTALVMGSEGNGLRRLTRENCDALFTIPLEGQVESLNVSVATGVCLYEVIRQRQC